MIEKLKSRSPYVGYAFVAIVVSLVCNFSYLLLLVTNQTDTGNRRLNNRHDKGVEIVIAEGVLSLSRDGFGYLVTEEGDSIYVDHRRRHWLNLNDGDRLRVEAAERTNFEAANLYMRRVLERNGQPFDYGALYRGSEQWHILLYQFVFYFFVL